MSDAGNKCATPQPPQPKDGARIFEWAQQLTQWLRRSRVIPGLGLKGHQLSSGYLISRSESDALHPFKIVATSAHDSDGAMTNLYTNVVYGTITGFDDGIYDDVPKFESVSGTKLDASPADYDLGTTNQTNRLYAVVLTDPTGAITDTYLEWFTTTQNDTEYVPDDYPDPGDTGTNGTYFLLVGSVVVSGAGASKNYEVNQAVTSSLTFKLCGSEAGWYAA